MQSSLKRLTHRPRIGLDLHVLDGIFQGSRTHCLELFRRVIASSVEFDFYVFADDLRGLLSSNESFAAPHVTPVHLPKRAAPVRLLWQFPSLAKQLGLSLLHVQYIAPPVISCATAVTVHDILFESHKEYFERSFVIRSRILVPRSIRRSSAVFTVSEFSRHQICETYGVSPERIHTIPNGVDSERFFPGNADSHVPESFGLRPKDYFLTVGRLEPRKNHAAIFQAWSKLKTPRPRLAVVGQRHFQFDNTFEVLRSLRLESDIKVLEDISDVQLPALYRNSKGFVYTSWAEGFGMPVLEAMASGVPVVSSANTALSEVAGGAALLVNPENSMEIANAVRTLDSNPEIRQDLILKGMQRALDYSWDRAAETVRAVYRNLFKLQGNAGDQERPLAS